ncbi:lipocalin family protein [Corynebacterium sp. P7003]|uniref:Lipocalin family protein n=1 Tax=Corynebacterium pygosceleis TaxID=2800406 RepID=A0ABT3WX04_9CORY|nr:lipocalin family protein [Corynebacterium pygosceleis]MCX7445342.1 lipocalin family protein [Corynebacterium pygosceleis]
MNWMRGKITVQLAALTAAGALAATLGAAPAVSEEGLPVRGFPGLPVSSSLPVAEGAELPQVPQLDLEGYQGTWHQVAALPHVFSIQCARDTTARYTLTGPETVRVVNSCTDWFGNPSGIEGQARVTDPGTGASLRVWFNGVPFQSPDGPTNYRVAWMSGDGGVVLVGSPDRTTGFVLSRGTSLSAREWSGVRAAVVAAGYDPCTFLTSPVGGGREDRQPLCVL